MAVPKKRMSKSKKNIRKTHWKEKISKQATRALFLAKFVLKQQENSDNIEGLSTENKTDSSI
uniref:ribosomal protein L32 n=1 Tax=Parallela transversalis TaxID=163324 RepID=UPI0010C28EC2|nr:ribosomal protein L32 [Parallela transversalis]AYQ22883.1 ribosomal protein L32 [Parallela transversalis]